MSPTQYYLFRRHHGHPYAIPQEDPHREVLLMNDFYAYDEAFFEEAVPADLMALNEEQALSLDNLGRAQRELIESTLPIDELLIPFRLSSQPIEPSRPPFNAEYLLYLFLYKDERDCVIGDLIESYTQVVERFNKRRADIWFYKQVAGSLWPLFRRAIVKIGGLVWIGRMLQRLIS